MKLKKKTLKFFVLTAGLCLSACAHKSPNIETQKSPKSNPQGIANQANAVIGESSDLWNSRKKLVQEKDLFEVFGLKGDFFEVYQIVCDTGRGETPQCSYLSLPPSVSKAPKTVRMTSKGSDKLFDLLSNLPIAKGETGLSTEFLSCRRYFEEGVQKWRHSCAVSVPVGILPHTSLPIPELTDEP